MHGYLGFSAFGLQPRLHTPKNIHIRRISAFVPLFLSLAAFHLMSCSLL